MIDFVKHYVNFELWVLHWSDVAATQNGHSCFLLSTWFLTKWLDFLFVLNFRYNRLSRHIRELAKKITDLDPNDPFRTEATAQLLEKL